MYLNKKILIGKSDDKEANLLLNKANRHGLITGASGSGKTITVKVLAESFSDAGVPVFLVDVKGDLSAMPISGEENENIKARLEKLKIDNFEFKGYPTNFFDVFGNMGNKVSMPISSINTRMLAKLLDLTNAQEGVLAIVFKIAKDENINLVTLDDLKKMLNYVGEKRKEYTLSYGNITTQSIGSIQRSLLAFSENDGEKLFGNPEIDVEDFIHYDEFTGQGFINILDATKLFNQPTLYATVILSILNRLYDTLDEVGDLDKPKLVFFFDEAHLVFSEMSDNIIKQLIQIVKLIRSKGIGLYFISQSPGDIPDEILAQLGNRIQHVLRSYTKSDEKVIKAAANSYRENENFDTIEAIKTLGTGEALISFQNEDGEPTIVDKYTILPPQSKMGTIDDTTRIRIFKENWLYNKYNIRVENTINQNIIAPKVSMSQFNKKTNNSLEPTKEKNEEVKMNKWQKKIVNKVENKIINKVINKIFK